MKTFVIENIDYLRGIHHTIIISDLIGNPPLFDRALPSPLFPDRPAAEWSSGPRHAGFSMNRLTTLFISNTFSLDRDLNEPIMIDLLYEGDPDLVLSTTNLTFTRLTWSQPQKISISVALDADTVNRAGVIILTALRGRKS